MESITEQVNQLIKKTLVMEKIEEKETDPWTQLSQPLPEDYLSEEEDSPQAQKETEKKQDFYPSETSI